MSALDSLIEIANELSLEEKFVILSVAKTMNTLHRIKDFDSSQKIILIKILQEGVDK